MSTYMYRFIIDIDGVEERPQYLSFTYAEYLYENLLMGIRKNLLPWSVRLSTSDGTVIRDSERRLGSISPWKGINLNRE